MESVDRFTRIRRIRHILSGWFVLLVAILVAPIPHLGPWLARLIALAGFLYALRVLTLGHWIQGLIQFGCFLALLISPKREVPNKPATPEVRNHASASWTRPSATAYQPPPPHREAWSNQAVEVPRRESPPQASPLESAQPSPIQTQAEVRPRAAEGPESGVREPVIARTPESEPPKEELVPTFPAVESPEEEALAFVINYRAAEERRDVDAAMKAFGESAFYCGQTRTAAEIRDDKAAYFRRWPVVTDSIVGTPTVEVLTQGYVRVRFRSTFKVHSPVERKWCSGTVDNEYLLLQGQRWRISSQDGKVSNLQRGTW